MDTKDKLISNLMKTSYKRKLVDDDHTAAKTHQRQQQFSYLTRSNAALLTFPLDSRIPLSLTDVREMMHVAYLPFTSFKAEGLCAISEKVSQLVVVVVSGISLRTFADISADSKKAFKYYLRNEQHMNPNSAGADADICARNLNVSYSLNNPLRTTFEKIHNNGSTCVWSSIQLWLPFLATNFEVGLEFLYPMLQNTIAKDLLLLGCTRRFERLIRKGEQPMPLTFSVQKNEEHRSKIIKHHRKLHNYTEILAAFNISSSSDSIKKKSEWCTNEGVRSSNDKFDRRLLLVTLEEMITENFPVPFSVYDKIVPKISPRVHRSSEDVPGYHNYVATKSEYAKVTENSPMFAIDCEFVHVTGRRLALGSISVVSESGQVLYHTLVKPTERIVDYATRYSGLTKTMLRDVTTTLKDVQEQLRRHLPPDAILVGHSINCDLRVMQMYHPYVIDTSTVYIQHNCKNVRSKLKTLAKQFLCREIQTSDKTGHCPTEDAIAAMDLVLLKLKYDYSFAFNTYDGEYEGNRYFLSLFEGLEKWWKAREEMGCAKNCSDAHTVICTPAHEHYYQEALKGLFFPNFFVAEDNDCLIDEVCRTLPHSDVTVAHLEADPQLGSPKMKPRIRALALLDEQLRRVYQACQENTMCCVVFEGQQSQTDSEVEDQRMQNGAFFYVIK